MMKFLVGGAVRDELLGLRPKDRDYVVVGATPEQMIADGYEQVGADFPVFLHPITKDEYALARTERKSGKGYSGFIVQTEGVTLEDDLLRRDLTINAMAKDSEGDIVDPFGGKEDLEAGVLRHVSDAFAEDPLRVLRVARFYARYDTFAIALETFELMEQLVVSGELNHLTPERVWGETEKALQESNPQRYFQVLKDCGALAVVMPWIKNVAMMASCKEPESRFASLVAAQDMDKNELDAMCIALRIPSRFKDVASAAQKIKNMDPTDHEKVLSVLMASDAFRKTHIFALAAQSVLQDEELFVVRAALKECLQVSADWLGLDVASMEGKEVGAAIREGRSQAVAKSLKRLDV